MPAITGSKTRHPPNGFLEIRPRSLSDLSRPAAQSVVSAQIAPRFRHLCSHKLLKLMVILTRIPLPSLRRSKSDRLLAHGPGSHLDARRFPPHRRIAPPLLSHPMKNLTYICSFLLIATGLYGYLAWQSLGATQQSVTALIPAFVGGAMLLGALIAIKKHMVGMHIAVLFSALGALAGLGRLIPGLIKGSLSFADAAPKFIVVMTVICLFYTVMAVRSFIAARRARG
jgi:hypothetical protein